MIRRLISACAALVLGLGVALAGSLPASAVLPAGPASDYSLPTSLPWLPSCSSMTGNINTVGGWSGRAAYGTGLPNNPGNVLPVRLSLSEPCINATGGVAVVLTPSSNVVSRASDENWSSVSFTIDGIQCVTTTGTEYLRNQLISSYLVPNSSSTTLTPVTAPMTSVLTNFSTNCARIVSLEAYAVTYNYIGAQVLQRFTWTAARSLGNTVYVDDAPANLVEYCAFPENAADILCNGLVDPDPVAWDATCGNTANTGNYGFEFVQFSPVNVETWGPAVAWLGACLFIPLTEFGGFDRNGALADAWAASPNAEVGAQIVTIADAFAYTSSCGVLFSTGESSVLPGLTVNTCDWDWAAPVRSVLFIGVILFGTLWFIQFIVDTSWSLMRNAPASPLKEADK